ncbi:Tetratricopeptide repeat-containing protein [Fodinibius salinus]|uniref:Tetratricopeptide repeat-containing protein n=1 Tax=Fodinibius salinus TaxID=860790 RepID=A0A5D3YGY5_9BACT|nr:hypothetical protein [Fodinibius salinus]TYP92547.1 Tetratricopeptide repeat-containing protein [Fodinibius salinus]
MFERPNNNDIEDKIHRYVDGQLSPEETEQLWAELVRDGEKLDYLKTVANVKGISQKSTKQKANVTRMYWYSAVAAAVALLIGVLAYMNFYTSTGTETVQPVEVVELDYYRSDGGSMSGQKAEDNVIQRAIRLANTGNVSKAIDLLQEALQSASKPQWIAKLSLNLGSLHYNQGNYKKSVQFYNRVLDQKSNIDVLILEKTYWYIGNAYFHLDQLGNARANIQKAYELNGAYRRVSKSYLEALSTAE